MNTVLDGVRVAAFTHFAAGPRVAQFLGALGADVIKVEPPTGEASRTLIRDAEGRFEGASPSFATLNRNQRCIALNLKSEGGREVARRLVDSADVLVENFKPGALRRLGFGYETVRKTNPRLVYCPISGFDPTGPRADDLGQDMLLQGASGMASLSGREGCGPAPVGVFAVDAYTAMINVIAILAALRHRDATGEGQLVHADMMSCALHMMMEEMAFALNVEPTIKRTATYAGHPQNRAPYGAYAAKDGDFVLSVAGPAQMRVLADAIGVTDAIGHLLTEAGLQRDRDAVGAALTRAFAGMTRAEVKAAADAAGIWMGPLRTLTEAAEDPSVVASGLIGEHAAAALPRYRYVREPITLTASPLRQDRPAPGLGEHTSEVMTELGFAPSEVERLAAEGAVLVA